MAQSMDVSTNRRTKRARDGADSGERALKRVQRDIARYGMDAVLKYSNRPLVSAYRSGVAQLMRPETKYFDTSFAFTVPGAADWTGTEVTCSNYIQSDGTTIGAYTDCALIPSAVGTGYGNIQGSKYLLKGISVRGDVSSAATAAQTSATAARSVRLVLVMDTMPQGSQAQGESVFPDMGSAAQCNYSYLALAAGTGGRFRILADKVVMLQPAIAGTDGANTFSTVLANAQYKMSWKPKRGIVVNIKSSGTTPATSQLSDCNIFLLAHASSTAPVLTLNGAARATFQD